MTKRDRILMLRGVGIGFIMAAILFFIMKNSIAENMREEITEQEIIERASDLGMVQIKEFEALHLTEEEIIEKARELGMEFVK